MHDELRAPGGAGGGEENDEAIGLSVVACARIVPQKIKRNSQLAKERAAGFANHCDLLDRARRLGVHTGEHAGEVDAAKARLTDEHLRARPLEEVIQLGGAKAGVDGDRAGAETRKAEEQREPFDAIGEPECHAIAGNYAFSAQPSSGAAGESIEFRVTDTALALNKSRRIRRRSSTGGCERCERSMQ